MVANQGNIDIHYYFNTDRDRVGHGAGGSCSCLDGIITQGTRIQGTRINNLVHINGVVGLAAKEIPTTTSLYSTDVKRITSMAIIIAPGTNKIK